MAEFKGDLLNAFAGFYLEKIAGFTSKTEASEYTDFFEKLEMDIFKYLITDRDKYNYLDEMKNLYEEFCHQKKHSETIFLNLRKEYETLTQLNKAKLSIEHLIKDDVTGDSLIPDNPILKTSMEVDMNLEITGMLQYSFENTSGIFKDPENILAAALAKKYIGQDGLARVKKDLKVEASDEELDEIMNMIVGFIPLLEDNLSDTEPDKLKEAEDIQKAVDILNKKIEDLERKLEYYRKEIASIDREITRRIFEILGKETLDFESSFPFLREKAEDIAIIMKRLEKPAKRDKELSFELKSTFPDAVELDEERITRVLSEWNLSLPDNAFIHGSRRELIPYRLTSQMLIQDDLYLQDLARRELIKIQDNEDRVTIVREEKTSFEKMIAEDLQKLMNVTSSFGKQLYKMNTFMSHQAGRPPMKGTERVVMADSGTNQQELGELSRLIRKFTKELDGRMLQENQKEVTLKLLGVLDFFDTLLNSIPEETSDEVNSIRESIQMIHGKLLRILGDYGLEIISSLDEKFNPEFHECVDTQSTSGKDPNIIVKEVLKGYKLGDAIIRYPKVIVSS